MEENLAKLQVKLESDQSFGEKLFNLETIGEVQSFLKENGMDFSEDEINAIRNALVKTAAKGELNDKDLEEVAGGLAATTVIAGISATITAANFTHNVTRGRW